MKKNKREVIRNTGVNKIAVVIIAVLLVVMYIYAFQKGSKSKALMGDSGTYQLIAMQDKWERAEAEKGGLEYCYQVAGEESLMLSLTTSSCPIDIYLEGKQIFHFENSENINVRPAYFLELPVDSNGKELRMVVSGTAEQAESICASAYIGTHRAVIEFFLHRTIYTCFVSIFLLLVGAIIVMLGISMYVIRKRKNYGSAGFSYLGLFMMASGIWMLNDSQFLMFFTNRYWKLGLLSSVSFCFMPVFLVLFIQSMLDGAGEQGERRAYIKYLSLPHLLVMFVYMALYAAGSAAKGYTLPVEHITILITLVICMRECVRNFRITGNREIQKVMIGFALFSVGCAFALFCYYFLPSVPYFGMYLLGFLLFSFLLANAAVNRMVSVIQSGAESETYQRLAFVDLMTGLKNRTAYMEECQNMEQAQICIMLDVNGLKSVNDKQGHQEGDELIMAAARSVREAFAPLGHCFRVGGDEFVVILDVTYQSMLESMLQALEEAIEKENRKRSFPLSIACGYAVPRDEEDLFDRVYREADEKMYARKKEMKKQISDRG